MTDSSREAGTPPATPAVCMYAQDWQWQDRVKCGNYSMIGSDKRTVTVITNLG